MTRMEAIATVARLLSVPESDLWLTGSQRYTSFYSDEAPMDATHDVDVLVRVDVKSWHAMEDTRRALMEQGATDNSKAYDTEDMNLIVKLHGYSVNLIVLSVVKYDAWVAGTRAVSWNWGPELSENKELRVKLFKAVRDAYLQGYAARQRVIDSAAR